MAIPAHPAQRNFRANSLVNQYQFRTAWYVENKWNDYGPECFMKKYFSLIDELLRSLPLCWQALKAETHKIKDSILNSEANAMFMGIFRAIEAMFKALIYYFILFTSLMLTGLGTYIVLFTTFRFAQLLWTLIFKEPWLWILQQNLSLDRQDGVA